MKTPYALRVDTVLILAVLLVGTALAGCSATSHTPGAKHERSATVNAATVSVQPPDRSSTTAAAPTAADPADVQLDSRPVIACFGDSLTAGLGIDSAQSYPADLQRMLDQAGYRYRVVNEGVSGDTTKDGLARLHHVLAHKPQIVVLEFGGNDGLRGLPVEEAQHNLSTMLAELQRGGAKVALAGITMPPQYGPQYITKFNAMYPTLAKRFRVPLLPFLLQDVWGVDGDIQPDGVHPTAQGARQVAANVERLIEPMLKHEGGR